MTAAIATRVFHLGDVLSVTGDKLVSPRGIAGVHELVAFMTGRPVFTHELPQASLACRRSLLAQHPELALIDDSGVDRDNWRAWLDVMAARFGEHVEVAALPEGMR